MNIQDNVEIPNQVSNTFQVNVNNWALGRKGWEKQVRRKTI